MLGAQAFNILDRDQSGTIEKNELLDAVRKLGFAVEEKAAVERMLQNVDTDDSGQITKDEFHRMMSRKLTKDDTDAEISQVLQTKDRNHSKSGPASPDFFLPDLLDLATFPVVVKI